MRRTKFRQQGRNFTSPLNNRFYAVTSLSIGTSPFRAGENIMDFAAENHRVTTVAELERLYGAPAGAAVEKELNYIHPHYRKLIAASPFVVLATRGPDGLDTSPRGDPAGFVEVEDEKT